MFAAVLLAALLIGCGGTPADTTDPTFSNVPTFTAFGPIAPPLDAGW